MKIDFLGIPVDAISREETVRLVKDAIARNEHISHVVINAAKVVLMRKDEELYNSVVSCDIINADGQSIVWAAKFLGKPLPERVAGVDLMEDLVSMAFNNNFKCFFFGAKEYVVKKVVEVINDKYGSDIIAGYRNGYFEEKDEPLIATQIAESGAQLLFVAIPSPRKENFLYKYKDVLHNVNFTMGVGGTFDIIAGITRRAPLWMRNNGLEWFYRFLQEPRRLWKRYLLGNTNFVVLVLKEKFHRLK